MRCLRAERRYAQLMAWKMTIAGLQEAWILPDVTVEFVKEQINELSEDKSGFWIQTGDQISKDSQMIFLPHGAPVLFTRTENDPHELRYTFERGNHLTDE